VSLTLHVDCVLAQTMTAEGRTAEQPEAKGGGTVCVCAYVCAFVWVRGVVKVVSMVTFLHCTIIHQHSDTMGPRRTPPPHPTACTK
jgi:hypothetical protein